jgi:hypothetical protein
MVVAGKDVKVEQLEQPFQDGAFMEMMKRGDLKVGQLYRVPAVNMGIYDKTRFDTANEERKLFLEETLVPQCELISEALQAQLVDPFFAFSPVQRRRPRKPNGDEGMSKSLDRQFEKARSERADSNLVVLIDTDTLPIASDVALAKAEYAEKLKSTFMLSPRRAEEWCGFDFDDERPERDEIWAQNNVVCITDPKLNASLVPGVKPDGEKPAGDGDKPKPAAEDKPRPAAKKELSDDERALVEKAKRLFRGLRRLTLEKMATDEELWSLSDADPLNDVGDARLKAEIRKARYAIREIIKKHATKEARMDAVRQWFNGVDRQYIRKVLGL